MDEKKLDFAKTYSRYEEVQRFGEPEINEMHFNHVTFTILGLERDYNFQFFKKSL